MKRDQQIVNLRQQPGRREYYRDHEQYDMDEARDVAEGGDYTTDSMSVPNGYRNNDYSAANYNFWEPRYTDFDESAYAPSADYGYNRDEYYPLDPAHHSYRRGQATGYGNDNSVQAREFERMLHNNRPGYYRMQDRDAYDRNEKEGFYDGYDEQRDGLPYGFSQYGNHESNSGHSRQYDHYSDNRQRRGSSSQQYRGDHRNYRNIPSHGDY